LRVHAHPLEKKKQHAYENEANAGHILSAHGFILDSLLRNVNIPIRC
jgi:hypothetical protein